jgi:site-specific DNA-methyltransferase (adenine-specific)
LPRRLPLPYWQADGATLYHGDCIQVLNQLPPAYVDLAFADPPFNSGYEYDVYSDDRTEDDYLHWTLAWLTALDRVLQPTASIYVAIGLRYQAEIKRLMHAPGWHWRDTICWHYTFGPNQNSIWTPSWVAIHYFTKSAKEWTWNSEPIRIPSARQTKYRDRRADPRGKVPPNTWTLTENDLLYSSESPGSGGPTELFGSSMNCWKHSRVAGTFKERVGHPCQMPEAVLERIVRASSNPGGLVLDPFLGSGTTAAVAVRLGRRFTGVELSQDYLDRYGIPRIQKARETAYE